MLQVKMHVYSNMISGYYFVEKLNLYFHGTSLIKYMYGLT